MLAPLELLSELPPSYTVPSQSNSPEVRRLHALATYLENDKIRPPHAVEQANTYLNTLLDAEATKLAAGGELAALRTAVSEVTMKEIHVSIDGSVIDGERTLTGTRSMPRTSTTSTNELAAPSKTAPPAPTGRTS